MIENDFVFFVFCGTETVHIFSPFPNPSCGMVMGFQTNYLVVSFSDTQTI